LCAAVISYKLCNAVVVDRAALPTITTTGHTGIPCD
jgi:hypothetical protein